MFALADLVCMPYHMNEAVSFFAHTMVEVLNLGPFERIFVGAVQRVRQRAVAGAARA